MYQLWSGWPHVGNADSVKDCGQERDIRVKQDNVEMEEEQGHGEAGQDQGEDWQHQGGREQDQGGREHGDGDRHEGLRRQSGEGGRDLL